MHKLVSCLTLVMLAFSPIAYGDANTSGKISEQHVFTPNQVERAVNTQSKALDHNQPTTGQNYYGTENSANCVKTACAMAGSLACDDQREILEMTEACKENSGDSCIRQACKAQGSLKCDEFSELKMIALKCGQHKKIESSKP